MMMIQPNQVIKILVTMLLPQFVLMSASPLAHAGQGKDTLLAILQPEDDVPADAVQLKELSLTGNNYNEACAYYELLLNAQRLARKAGANLLKIKERKAHSRTQRCDELTVILYKTAEPQKAEQSFRWNAARPLTWEDFRGPVRAGSEERTAAETSCGIGIETNLANNAGKARVYVFSTFDKRTSWVREGKEQPDVLAHEQGHWNICELYTRKMQERFDRTEITGATLSRKVNDIYNQISEEYIKRQELYEQETMHGTIPEAQKRWTKMINKELGTETSARL